MRIRFTTFSFALAAMTLVGIAHATPSTEVNVAGKIRPSSPTCSVAAPSEVEYGVIPRERIKPDGITLLDKRRFQILVFCNNSTKLAIRFNDTKDGTAADNTDFWGEIAQHLPNAKQEHARGLGLDSDNQKIGAVFLRATAAYFNTNASSSGEDAWLIYQTGGKWTTETGYLRPTIQYALSAKERPDILSPLRGTKFGVDVEVAPALDSKRLNLAKKISIDGKLTAEVVYL